MALITDIQLRDCSVEPSKLNTAGKFTVSGLSACMIAVGSNAAANGDPPRGCFDLTTSNSVSSYFESTSGTGRSTIIMKVPEGEWHIKSEGTDLTISSSGGAGVVCIPALSGSVSGVASSQWTTTGSGIYYNDGNVGFGSISDPQVPIHSDGKICGTILCASTSASSVDICATQCVVAGSCAVSPVFRGTSVGLCCQGSAAGCPTGYYELIACDGGGAEQAYGQIQACVVDGTATTECGATIISAICGGAMYNALFARHNCVASVPVFCAQADVYTPTVCATTTVVSPIVSGPTCVTTPIVCATSYIMTPAICSTTLTYVEGDQEVLRLASSNATENPFISFYETGCGGTRRAYLQYNTADNWFGLISEEGGLICLGNCAHSTCCFTSGALCATTCVIAQCCVYSSVLCGNAIYGNVCIAASGPLCSAANVISPCLCAVQCLHANVICNYTGLQIGPGGFARCGLCLHITSDSACICTAKHFLLYKNQSQCGYFGGIAWMNCNSDNCIQSTCACIMYCNCANTSSICTFGAINMVVFRQCAASVCRCACVILQGCAFTINSGIFCLTSTYINSSSNICTTAIVQSCFLCLCATSNPILSINTTCAKYSLNICTNCNLCVGGTLGKAAGSFVIDHPCSDYITPNRYNAMNLIHGFEEGPKYGIFYEGNAKLCNGIATVNLPEYFDKLVNRDDEIFVHITPVGGFSPMTIMCDNCVVCGNCFQVCTSGSSTQNKNAKFTWRVSASRGDKYVIEDNTQTDNKGRLIVEQWRKDEDICDSIVVDNILDQTDKDDRCNYIKFKCKV